MPQELPYLRYNLESLWGMSERSSDWRVWSPKRSLSYLWRRQRSQSCQGTTCFLLQKHLRVFPTPTLDTFGILWTPKASEFQRHFGVLLILSPFQQSPILLRAPSTLTPRLTPPPKIAPRPPPPPKVARRPLWTPYPPIQTLLQCYLETLQVVVEIRRPPL